MAKLDWYERKVRQWDRETARLRKALAGVLADLFAENDPRLDPARKDDVMLRITAKRLRDAATALREAEDS